MIMMMMGREGPNEILLRFEQTDAMCPILLQGE